jgi:hypothetical protein
MLGFAPIENYGKIPSVDSRPAQSLGETADGQFATSIESTGSVGAVVLDDFFCFFSHS